LTLDQIIAKARTDRRDQKPPVLSAMEDAAPVVGAELVPVPDVVREPLPEVELVPDADPVAVLDDVELLEELEALEPTTMLAHAMRVLLA
jgi:hypothetical protein